MYSNGPPRYATQPRTYAHIPVDRLQRFPRNTDKSRGLRHFSNRVCEKVKEKGQTNYNEVADELVTEYFESLLQPPPSSEKQQYDSKNIRRRVYDALNVLMAMNIIEKEKKEIRWVGLPTSSVAERRRLEEERTQRRERIRQKSDQLREYIIQLVAYKSLVHRNRENERNNGRPSEQSILYLPFIILNTERETNVDCAISHDKTEYAMSFDRPFEIHDDIEVLKRMGMAHGLDTGRVDDVDVDRVKESLPPALRVYIDQIVEGADEAEQEQNADNPTHGLLTDEAQHTPESRSPLPTEVKSTNFVSTRLNPANGHLVPTSASQHRMTGHVVGSSIPHRRFCTTGATPRSFGGASGLAAPVGYARPMFARGGTGNRTYIQRIPNAGRYVTPSQSAVFQTAQRSHTRQQLYLVQSNGGAPQPIQSNRYQAYPTPRTQPYPPRTVSYQVANPAQSSRQPMAQQAVEYADNQYEEYVQIDGPDSEYFQMNG